MSKEFSDLHASVSTSRPMLASGTNNCVVILIEFSDVAFKKDKQEFENLLFSTSAYSMNSYFKDVSYDVLNVTGTVFGWYTAAHNRSYYGDSQSGKGVYPENSQGLVEEALIKLNESVTDFSDYDKDGDGIVDALFVIYSGYCDPYRVNDRDLIFPDKWELSTGENSPGVYETAGGQAFNEYVILPEISLNASDDLLYDDVIIEVGVFCYNYGSILGIPFLSDKSINAGTGDYYSYGLGDYCLMSNNYLGDERERRNSADVPFHLCAWAKSYMGWISPVEITENEFSFEIINVEENPVAYKVIANSSLKGDDEYFLIVNRQKKGFDAGLNSSGLLIYHIDESVEWVGVDENEANNEVSHKLVDLEAADGSEDLDQRRNFSDPGDFFAVGMIFDSTSTPNSNTYPNEKNTSGRKIKFSLTVVSDAAGIVTVDIVVRGEYPEVKTGTSNIFTPNGDGYNDKIVFKQAQGTYDVTIHIYDSLGRKIKEMAGTEWDGTDSKSRAVPGGVYIYQIEYEDKTVANGTVVVAR